jgi:uncharacterized protein YndB with AHSA1/START domain
MNVIRQSVHFAAPAKRLFEIFTTPRLHAAITGGPVTIGRKAGSRFRAFDGALTGRVLLTVPGQLVVMNWRSTMFKPKDPDSLLVLSFTDSWRGGQIEMIHSGVPDHDMRGVRLGWPKYYWKPMRAFLAKKRRKK